MNKIVGQILSLICFSMVIISVSVNAQVAKPTGNTLDKGDFKVGFSPKTKAKNPKKVIPKEFRELLQETADSLNKIIALPYDVYLNFDECGQANAFYSSDTKEITMCYEFLVDFAEAFSTISEDEDQIADMVGGATVFFFFHELGHCLIDVWDLPATGREEDAVDQLAMVILLDGTPEGQNMVLNGARFFALNSEEGEAGNLAFWGVHSFNQQRFYDILCLVYGSNPVNNKKFISENLLPRDRAGGCSQEYKRVDRAWERLLTPYLKP